MVFSATSLIARRLLERHRFRQEESRTARAAIGPTVFDGFRAGPLRPKAVLLCPLT